MPGKSIFDRINDSKQIQCLVIARPSLITNHQKLSTLSTANGIKHIEHYNKESGNINKRVI